MVWLQAVSILCGILNLPSPPAKIAKYVRYIGSCVEDIAQESMKEALEEAIEETENNEQRELTVALDGSWQKRGHVSLNGIVTATSGDASKVIDVVILSKHCRCPNKTKMNISKTVKLITVVQVGVWKWKV